ncbi:SDR family NAD(P)-dependent oxidoreductase [Lishizhenia sp.]|uniref:SDR family NAD(P)-dependent oxidoreductase n=1 Tax=Lishizhenia sp. TaxID=2497594 RepID=UPI00299F4D00|nr:SDR family NAD(P)-dependent oxidoreductase [Lishizhenia sp.]MDX1446662.1 SDR family NAD(P)-dependent oxidoreductase [Lishizhenia sp.]
MQNSKTALITGATSGIGSAIAEHLAQQGYSLYMLGRSQEKLTNTKNHLRKLNPNVNVHPILCDLASKSSTLKACEEVGSIAASIDILILNAGLWNFQFKETEDNIEETLQVNVLSHLMIFEKLIHLVPKNNQSKVLFTTSGLHQGTINFEDLEFRTNFSGYKCYRQSKLAVLMLTRWFSQQDEFKGISFYCVHPGMVNTQLGRSAGWFSRSIFKLFGKPKHKGAKTHIFLIDQDPKLLTSGECYANCAVTPTSSYSYDMKVGERLWKVLKEYLN